MNKLMKCIFDLDADLKRNEASIRVALGVVGLVGAGVMACNSTVKAVRIADELEDKRRREGSKQTKKEIIVEDAKNIAPLYIGPMIIMGLSIHNVCKGYSMTYGKALAYAAAYEMERQNSKEYEAKVIEKLGEKKEQEIKDEICKDKLQKNPVVDNEVIITEDGNSLIYDVPSGRYFRSSIEKIKRIQNELNARLIQEMYISLNEFYYELGLRQTGLGNDMGWNINDGMIDIRFSSQIAENDEPCIVISYHVEPRFD